MAAEVVLARDHASALPWHHLPRAVVVTRVVVVDEVPEVVELTVVGARRKERWRLAWTRVEALTLPLVVARRAKAPWPQPPRKLAILWQCCFMCGG
jgi:hypothetical protein